MGSFPPPESIVAPPVVGRRISMDEQVDYLGDLVQRVQGLLVGL